MSTTPVVGAWRQRRLWACPRDRRVTGSRIARIAASSGDTGEQLPASGLHRAALVQRGSDGGATGIPLTAYEGTGAGNPASPNASRMSRFVSKYTCQ